MKGIAQKMGKTNMKTANLTVSIDKGMTVSKTGVTPLEALLLTAEHHKNAGGTPFVDEEIKAADGSEEKGTDGKVVKKPGTAVDVSRTDDEELDRLRARYGVNKVKAIVAEVKNFPTTYKDAIDRGTKVVLPSSPLASTRLI